MARLCKVSFTDGAQMTHTVTVPAPARYEAAGLGIAEFQKSGLAVAGVNPSTRLRITVEPPSTTHEISVAKLHAWLNTNGRSPREQAKKADLRRLIERG